MPQLPISPLHSPGYNMMEMETDQHPHCSNTIIGTEHPPCPPADLVTVEKANNSRQFIRSLAQLVKMADASCLPGILIVKSIGITHSTQQPHSQKHKRLIG